MRTSMALSEVELRVDILKRGRHEIETVEVILDHRQFNLMTPSQLWDLAMSKVPADHEFRGARVHVAYDLTHDTSERSPESRVLGVSETETAEVLRLVRSPEIQAEGVHVDKNMADKIRTLVDARYLQIALDQSAGPGMYRVRIRSEKELGK